MGSCCWSGENDTSDCGSYCCTTGDCCTFDQLIVGCCSSDEGC